MSISERGGGEDVNFRGGKRCQFQRPEKMSISEAGENVKFSQGVGRKASKGKDPSFPCIPILTLGNLLWKCIIKGISSRS